MKEKTIKPEEFARVQGKKWQPVQLSNEVLFECFSRIPKEKIKGVYASGSHASSIPRTTSHNREERLVGGIDVYRLAPDDPVNYNKDWYAVVCRPEDNLLHIIGPQKDAEHWTNELPDRLIVAEILY